MKLLLYSIAILLATVGCNNSPNSYQIRNDEKIANELMKNVAQELNTKLNLYPCGTGGRMMHEIKMLALAFDYYQPITIEEGRNLLITSIDIFVKAVNDDERIRPYLANYPFEPKNVQIRIFLRNPNGSNPGPGEFAVISSIDGILEYDVNDPKNPLFTTIHKESYQEALQAQKTSDSHLLKIAQ